MRQENGDGLVARYLGKLADFVQGEACKVLGVMEEIETFERRIERIKAFLRHAERQHGDTSLRARVMESKDLMYV